MEAARGSTVKPNLNWTQLKRLMLRVTIIRRLYYPVGSVETAGCSPNETAGSSTDQSAFYKQANGSAVCLIADTVEGSCKGRWRFLMSSYPWTPGGTANGLDEWTYGFHFIIMRSQEVPSGFSGGYRMNYTLLLLNTMEFIG